MPDLDSPTPDPEPTAAPVLRTEAGLRRITEGELAPLTQPIRIVEYDPRWTLLFAREAERIAAALDDPCGCLSTSARPRCLVFAAKPRIDMVLAVDDSADESAYFPALEAAGYRLQIREPDWYEHRLLKGPEMDSNLHVFCAGCTEIDRMLLFRGWLRCTPDDRRLYQQTKRRLARRTWTYMQHYADAKIAVVEEILGRAQAAAAAKDR